jgi:signal transduction histidine kinase
MRSTPGTPYSLIQALSRRRLLAVSVLLLALVLGSVLSLVLLYVQSRNEMTALNKERLRTSALAASMLLSKTDLVGLLAGEDGAQAEASLLLGQLQQESGATDIRLFDKAGDTVLELQEDIAGIYDQAEFIAAVEGSPAFTKPQRAKGHYFQSCYYPVTDPLENDVIAIVRVQADVTFEDTLAGVRRWAIVLALANAAVALGLGLVFWRLQHRLATAESRQLLSERLTSMGRLAAGVAHELRNPLNTINQSIALLRKRYDPESKDKFFGYIPSEVSRMNGLVKEFLVLAREQKLNLSRQNLADIAERIQSQFKQECEQRGIAYNHSSNGQVDTDLDPGRIVQIGINLVMNALDAMQDGGVLTSRVGHTGKKVYWSISDTGCGISNENMEKITEAFFTTKQEGTGLGLAITQQIAVQHGGRMEIDSEEGKGSTFTLWLPRRRE